MSMDDLRRAGGSPIRLEPTRRKYDNLYARDRIAESLRELDRNEPNLPRVRHMLAAALGTLGGAPPGQDVLRSAPQETEDAG